MIVLSLPLFDFRPVSWPLHAWSIASSYRVQHPNDDDKYTDNLWTCQALSVGDGKKKQQKVRKFNDLKGGKKFRLRLKNPLLARVYLKSSPEVDAAMVSKKDARSGAFLHPARGADIQPVPANPVQGQTAGDVAGEARRRRRAGGPPSYCSPLTISQGGKRQGEWDPRHV